MELCAGYPKKGLDSVACNFASFISPKMLLFERFSLNRQVFWPYGYDTLNESLLLQDFF